MINIILAGILAASSPGLHGPYPCVALDGDTMKCVTTTKTITIRMTGIDSPELPGHCHKLRICAPGDPFAAKASLAEKIKDAHVYYRSLGIDKYGRTIGLSFARKINLSCYQLRTGHAIYKPKWDNQKRLYKSCLTARKI